MNSEQSEEIAKRICMRFGYFSGNQSEGSIYFSYDEIKSLLDAADKLEEMTCGRFVFEVKETAV